MFAHVLDATLTYGLCYGNVSSISQELPACLWQRWEKRLLTHAGYDVSHQHTFPFFSDVIKTYQKHVFSHQQNIILFILMMKHETNPCVFKWLSGWTICPLCSSSRATRQPIPSFFLLYFFFSTLIGKAAVAMCQRSCLFFQVTSLVSRCLVGWKWR